ncbi:hypothetical protein ACFWZU_15725 [Frateuria sp. GZRR33]|uniref:hypothetical protein n=1 Tax=Frateuria sp. GZRR33 TaxID=3351535 RepID=UPI003EDBF507
MPTLDQIAQALKAADAAGNTEDARRLAQAYKQMRDAQAQPSEAQPAAQSQASNDGELTLSDLITGRRPPPTVGHQIGRAFAMAGRNVVHGLASIPSLINDPIVNTLNYAEDKLGIDPQYRFGTAGQAADYVLNKAGVPDYQPQNGTERVVGDIEQAIGGSLGGSGVARYLSKAASPVVSAIGDTMQANQGTQLASVVGGSSLAGLTREGGGGPVAQTVAGLVGGTLGASPQIGAATLRGLVRGGEAGRQRMLANIADFERAGTTPTAGQAAQNGRMQGLESLLSKAPGGAGVMRRAAEDQAVQVSEGLDAIGGKLAPYSDPARVGRVIDRGVTGEGGFIDRFKQQSSALYDQLDQHIAPQTRVSVNATANALDVLNQSIPGAPSLSRFFQNAKIGSLKSAFKSDTQGEAAAMSRPEVAGQVQALRDEAAAKSAYGQQVSEGTASALEGQNRVRQALGMKPKAAPEAAPVTADDEIADLLAQMADGKLPYEAVKKLRTLVGNELENVSIVSDVPRSKWKALYGALSQDMKNAADEAGPAAQKAFGRANAYYQAGSSRIDALSTVLDKSGGPEAIYNAATSGTRDGATTLRTVMQSLKPDEQKVLASTMIRRLGKATAGQQNATGDEFSMSTFLTNWNKLSPQAKSTLFDRFGSGFRSDMDAVARMAANVRQGSKVFANPSGSASTGAQLGTVGGFVMAALSGNVGTASAIAGAAGGANLLARALTSPAAVKFLARTSRVPLQGLVPMLASLHASAQKSNDPGLRELDTALQQAVNDQKRRQQQEGQ